MSILSIVLWVYFFNVIAILTIVFFEKGNLPIVTAWTIVSLILPIIGFFIYFILGSTYKVKILSKKYSLKQIEKDYKNIIDEAKTKLEVDYRSTSYSDMIKLNSNSCLGILTGDNKIQIFNNAEDKYEKLFSDIKDAKESINIEYYIFKSKDNIGKELIKLLENKAAQGVNVRVIYDRLGSKKTSENDFKSLEKEGGVIQRFLPSLFRTLVTANYRMHRKIVVIDNTISYTGGINIGDEYLGKKDSISPWRDTSIRIIGDASYVLQMRFLIDWQYLKLQNKENIQKFSIGEVIPTKQNQAIEEGESLVQVLSSGPDSRFRYIRDSYIKLISSAKRYIYIQTPYLAPEEVILENIRIASQSGVDVRIMIPGVPDKKSIYLVTLSYAEELIKYGVKIYLYNGFIHSKTAVSDDNITIIGTSNIDEISFKYDYEDDIIVYDEKFAMDNRIQFENDILNSKMMKLNEEKNKGILYRIKQTVSRIIAPLV